MSNEATREDVWNTVERKFASVSKYAAVAQEDAKLNALDSVNIENQFVSKHSWNAELDVHVSDVTNPILFEHKTS